MTDNSAAAELKPLVWTKERPKENGYYWFRLGDGYEAHVDHIREYPEGFFDVDTLQMVADKGGEWAGPIPKPEKLAPVCSAPHVDQDSKNEIG